MKLAKILGTVAVVAALALAAGCSQNQKKCGSGCGGSGCGGGCGQKADPAAKAQTANIEQKQCPVTGEAINPAAFTEYQGKKVYFCCKGCIAKFDKEPEKYAANIK
jgi:YHS domain-containing protein